MNAIFVCSTAGNPSASSVRYIGLEGAGATWQAAAGSGNADGIAAQPIPHAMTLDHLRIKLATSPGTAGQTTKILTFVVMVNGTASSLSVAINADNTTGSDTNAGHAISLNAGDLVSIRCTPSGTPTLPTGFRASTRQAASGQFAILGGNATAITATTFSPPQGVGATTGTEANIQVVLPCACTAIKNLYVKNSVDPTPGNWTVTVRKNAADTSGPLQVNIPAGQTLNTVPTPDTTNTPSFAAGDRCTIHLTAAASPATSLITWGLTVVPTTDGQAFWTSSASPLAATGTANMNYIVGATGTFLTTDAAVQAAVQACSINALYVYLSANPGGGSKNYTIAVFKGGSTTAATVTTNAIAGANITGLAVAIVDDDLLNIDIVPSGTPTGSRIATGILYSSGGIITIAPAGPAGAATVSVTRVARDRQLWNTVGP